MLLLCLLILRGMLMYIHCLIRRISKVTGNKFAPTLDDLFSPTALPTFCWMGFPALNASMLTQKLQVVPSDTEFQVHFI